MTTHRLNFEKEHHAQAAAPAEVQAHQNQRMEDGKAKGKETGTINGKIQERHQLIPRHHHHQPAEGVILPTDSKTGRDDDPDSQSDKDHGMDTGSPTAASN